jgi:hypothetical protein
MVGTLVGPADGGHTEVEQAITLLTAFHAEASRRAGRRTIGGDRGYAKRHLLEAARGLALTPHVAQNDTDRVRVLDGRTTRHPGYAVSQRHRKRIKESFDWGKTIGLIRKSRYRRLPRVYWIFALPRRPTIWCACAPSSGRACAPPNARAVTAAAPARGAPPVQRPAWAVLAAAA